MDKDRVKGFVKHVVGRGKETVGEAVVDRKMQEDGKIERIDGAAQHAVGSLGDTARDIFRR